MSELERIHRELVTFILKNKSRRREIASMAGIHVNTLAYFVNGKRSCSFHMVVRIESAINLIKNGSEED